MLQRVYTAVTAGGKDDRILDSDKQLHLSDMEGASSSRQDHGDSGKLQLVAFEKCPAQGRNVRNLDHLDTGLADLSFQPFKAAE